MSVGIFSASNALGHIGRGFRQKFWPLLGWLLLGFIPIALIIGIAELIFDHAFFSSIVLLDQLVVFDDSGGLDLTLLPIYFITMTWFGLFGARLGTLAILNQPLTAGDAAMRRGFSRLVFAILVNLIFFMIIGFILFYYRSCYCIYCIDNSNSLMSLVSFY